MGNAFKKKGIIIRTEEIEVKSEIILNETGKAIYSKLPIKSTVNLWGEEIYFPIPLEILRSPDAREVVEVGEIGYWPEGSAFCIFFGKTPSSRGDEIRAASPVNIFGKIDGDAKVFLGVEGGSQISVTVGK